jgi:hypothetical protein
MSPSYTAKKSINVGERKSAGPAGDRSEQLPKELSLAESELRFR